MPGPADDFALPADTHAALSDDARARLLAAVQATRDARKAALVRTIDEALANVPRLLRGALKLVLFP